MKAGTLESVPVFIRTPWHGRARGGSPKSVW